MTSAMHGIESNISEMNVASDPKFSYEQQALQQWQDNCMGQCHYAHVASPGPNGPRPNTPLTDRYSSAMAGVGQSGVQFFGGMSMVMSAMPPTRYSNVEVRKWYHRQEDEIPNLIDTDLSLKEQARWAFDYRNNIRTKGRYLMEDRSEAMKYMVNDPNWAWDDLIQHTINKGKSGDDIYLEIINSAQKSRPSIDTALGINRVPQ